ncbi:MAG: hypothetical protein J5950_00640 [Clostridia bacterium]|nr:hypothetical protein [Clostridia bacterium]
MKRHILLLLLPVMLLAAIALISTTTPVYAAYTFTAYGEGERNPVRIDGDCTMGQRVNVAAEFVGFSFNMPTWNTTDAEATLGVFKWDTDIDKTLESEPLFSKHFQCKDNATNIVRFKETPLEAGEYLFLIYDISGTVGCWTFSSNAISLGYCYANGLEQEWDMELAIIFTTKTSTPVKECESQSISYTPVKPPKEYVIPEDSLIYTHEVMPDTWVFTDALGRTALTYEDVGGPKENKTIALFYWTWHDSQRYGSVPVNLQKVSEEHPEAIANYNDKFWGTVGTGYVWNESVYGYYVSLDSWVLRKHAELLANAGVDVIFTDNTNGTLTWRESYMTLYETWTKAMQDGVKTPKVSFMLPFSAGDNANTQLKMLFTDIYKPRKYQPLWFYWDEKPMLMAWSGKLQLSDPMENNILNYFTYRRNIPGYITEDAATMYGSWGWLSMYPQAYYYANEEDAANNKVEQVTVGVAQNHNYRTHTLSAMNNPYNAGRSYTLDESHLGEPNSKLYGYNFSEQFDYALTLDPRVIFVTGWNELSVGRYDEWGGVKNAFPDQFNDENSRDIEPSRGDLQDNYYYLLVNYVRKYKGVREIPTPSDPINITLDAGQDAWKDVAPYYAAYIGNTGDRDAYGYGKIKYTEYSGRNDIIGAQIARDNDYMYFHVECNDNITPYTDNLWMNLLIDSNQENQGWNTFDYVVNKSPASASAVVLERFTGDGYATEKVADCEYKVDGRYMTVKIKKSDIGITADKYTVNFAWTDNVHDVDDTGAENEGGKPIYTSFSGDIMEFYVSGDVAPGGRFKFSYVVGQEKEVEKDNTEEVKDGINPLLIILPVAAAVLAAAAAVVVVLRSKKKN